MQAHKDYTPLSGKQNNVRHHLEMSDLQRVFLYVHSILPFALPFESSLFTTAFFFFCAAKVRDAHSWRGMGGVGAALLFCQRNSVSQFHAVKW